MFSFEIWCKVMQIEKKKKEKKKDSWKRNFKEKYDVFSL